MTEKILHSVHTLIFKLFARAEDHISIKQFQINFDISIVNSFFMKTIYINNVTEIIISIDFYLKGSYTQQFHTI